MPKAKFPFTAIESSTKLAQEYPDKAIRPQLDEAAFQSAWNAGQAMTLDEVIAYALDYGLDKN